MKKIQGCWKRMKLQIKKKFDEQRRERKKTGRGESPASPIYISLETNYDNVFFGSLYFLDMLAPKITRSIVIRSNAPWYIEEIAIQERKTRRPERK